jgi:hypothetical protein
MIFTFYGGKIVESIFYSKFADEEAKKRHFKQKK